MENNNDKLKEQKAPEKNSDQAFVQVGHNGEPVIPQTTERAEPGSESENDDRSPLPGRP